MSQSTVTETPSPDAPGTPETASSQTGSSRTASAKTSSAEAGSRLFDYQRWEARLPEISEQYREASPYPHIHLEGLLEPALAQRLVEEFPAPDAASWIQYKHYNENKLGNTRREHFPETIGQVVDELCSPRFVDWLSQLTGIEGLMADPSLEGGGMHQTERGGFLNIHADFTMHHHKTNWRRRCNLILFLNPGWQEEWRGALELWDRGMKRSEEEVLPRLNHAVLFNTDEDSYHGYPDPIQCPAGVTRKSLALYYYTEEQNPHYKARSTDYRARPGERWKAPLIWLDKAAVALYSWLKRKLGLSDDFASRVLGFLSRKKK